MSSPTTFCNVPVSTGFDGRAPRSYVSLDWVINFGLRTRASQLSGPLTLPCDAGSISICLHDVAVTASLPYDLILGLDWLHLVWNSAPQPVVHLASGSLDLRTIGSMFAQSSSMATITALSIPRSRDGMSGFGGPPMLCVMSNPNVCVSLELLGAMPLGGLPPMADRQDPLPASSNTSDAPIPPSADPLMLADSTVHPCF
ncbi:hypothetical protein B0H11DRAFT_2273269 [Mycena galericulata]|nr:hypothetical protein B0H11DRAFT_2273269 [Mycena galericulata]